MGMLKIGHIALALFIGLGGAIKVLRLEFQVEHWQLYGYPLWFLTMTGILEIVAMTGLLLGLRNRKLALLSSVGVGLLMTGAIYTHIFQAQQPPFTTIPAIICLLLSMLIIFEKRLPKRLPDNSREKHGAI